MDRKGILVLSVVVALLGLCAVGYGEPPESESEEVKKVTWLDTLLAGGVIGALIIALSVISLALAIEHFVNIRREKIMPPELQSEIEVLFEDEAFEEALELCEAEPSYFTNVVGDTLPKMDEGYYPMLEAMSESAGRENTKLLQKIGYLSLIGNIAPMMGLLGTVQGMIAAFQTIAVTTAPDPGELASGISLALVTTFLGLIVAIPTMVSFFYFRNRVVRLGMEVEETCAELFTKFKP